MTLAEKIFARHMVTPERNGRRGGRKTRRHGFTRVDLRFSHEYVTPMAAIFYEQYVGKDVPVNDASSIRFFRDHLTFLDEVISEEKKKIGLLDLATQLKVQAGGLRQAAGNQAPRRTYRPQGFRRHLPLGDARDLRAARTGERRLRLAYAARGRDRMHRLRHWHHRRLQFLDHQRRSGEGAGVGEDRDSREEARRT